MTEGVAYVAFLTVVAVTLLLMTVGLAVIGILLARQNRKATKSS